jgi:hypothetical protein
MILRPPQSGFILDNDHAERTAFHRRTCNTTDVTGEIPEEFSKSIIRFLSETTAIKTRARNRNSADAKIFTTFPMCTRAAILL